MFDEFVKYAQTYSGYKNKIRNLYAELKNLTVIQKICCVAKGTYCRKLQKRITTLYKSLGAVKEKPLVKGYYNAVDSAEQIFYSTISEHFAEYETLQSVYKCYTPNLVKAIDVRSIVYRNSLGNNLHLMPINKSYNLSSRNR